MKLRILVPVLILLLINGVYAQKQNGKEKIGSVGGYDMGHVDCVKQDNLYLISYENQNDVQVNDYDDFSIKSEDFEEVYKTLITGFEEKQKTEIHIPTTLNYVEVEYTKLLGKMMVRFTQSNKKGALGVSFSAWYSQKEIKKLFGQQ